MAMDKTTTRRMIGAIVLVLVAALVLAYLLKSKGNKPEVEKIQDVTLPSSPILSFPGDGSNDAGKAGTTIADTDSVDTSKAVGLDIIPRGASSQQQPADAVSQAARNNADDSKKDKASDKTADADKKQRKDLKEADVVTLGNQDRVKARDKDKADDSKSSKSSEKKSSREKREEKKDKPRLVNEKKLPKYSDKDKKAKELPKRDESADTAAAGVGAGAAATGADIASSDDIPTTGFSIQLLATSSESKAGAVKQQMVDEGYPAYISTAEKDGKTLYRVRVGAYQERSEIDEVQARMKRRYTKNDNIQNSLVVTN